MFDIETKKEMKKMEDQANAKKSLAELNRSISEIDKMLGEFKMDALQQLNENNEEGFEMIANSIFYFQDVRRMINTVRIQYQTYVKTGQIMGTIEGIRPVLKATAKQMDSLPSYKKNTKDFAKFKKGLMKGQLNVQAMANMISTINPALGTTRSKEELDDLKASLLMRVDPTVQTNLNTSSSSQNEDFFNEINL